MKVNHRGSKSIVTSNKQRDALEEVAKLRTANERAVQRAATLQVELEAERKQTGALKSKLYKITQLDLSGCSQTEAQRRIAAVKP